MQIEDAHTHFFSRPFFDALAGMSPSGKEPEALLAELATRTGLEIPPAGLEAHRDRWIAEMDGNQVARMVTFASLPQEAGAVAEAAAGSGGRLLPYALVNPAADDAPGFVARALGELGFRGLLAFPAMHHVPLDDERWMPILRCAEEHAAPVVVHCGILKVKLRDLVGLPRRYDIRLANPLRVVPAADRHPQLPFVLPHFGGGFLREALMAADQCENVLFDTSSSNAWLRAQPGAPDLPGLFRLALGVVGPERILFGTDSSTFPRGYRRDLLDAQRAALDSAGASAEVQAAILGGNLRRLLP